MKEYLHKIAKDSVPYQPIRLKDWTREDIIKMLAKYGAKRGAEIGVERGKFSEYICQTIPGLELVCVDIWTMGDDIRSKKRGQETAEGMCKVAQARLKKYNAKIIRAKSTDAVQDIPYESLDFVYIDACHEFDYVMQDIIEWAKRVKRGGLVAGHDYYRFRNAGVVEAVDVYVRCHKIQELFLTGEKTPSWFFFKEFKP